MSTAAGTQALSGLRLTSAPTARGFLALSVASVDGKPLAQSARLVLSAFDKAENAGLVWNAERTFAPKAWQTGPAEVHGVSADLVLRGRRASRVRALAPDGSLRAEIPATITADGLAFHIEPSQRAMWYEIVTP